MLLVKSYCVSKSILTRTRQQARQTEDDQLRSSLSTQNQNTSSKTAQTTKIIKVCKLLIEMALILLQLTTLACLAVVDAVLTLQRLDFSAGAP